MSVIQKSGRNTLQMVCWEQMIAADNPVRVIDAFVDYLDVSALGFSQKGKQKNGRPAYSVTSLLKLYFYGYLNWIRSSRKLEKACQCNIELFWLLEELRPGYKTIANFRKDHPSALRATFKQLNRFLQGQGLFSSDVVAIDGTKIQAQNSKKNNYNDKKIQRHLDYIEQKTTTYLAVLDQLDLEETAEEEGYLELNEQLDALSARAKKYKGLEEDLAKVRKNHQAQLSTTDPDARALPKKMNIVAVSYNIQTAVESSHKLITNYEVTNENDTYALSGVAKAAQSFLGLEQMKVLADKGYDTGMELQACGLANIETYVSPRKKVYAGKDPKYAKHKFEYDAATHRYVCPKGKFLKTNGSWYDKYKKKDSQHRKNYRFQRFKASYQDCAVCPSKNECAGTAKLNRRKGREIERSEYEESVVENRERYRLNKALYRTRQQIVEHPFGTIKRQWGYDYTLLKTKEKVAGEFALVFGAYNLRRAMSIIGIAALISLLKTGFYSYIRLIRLNLSGSKPIRLGRSISPLFFGGRFTALRC